MKSNKKAIIIAIIVGFILLFIICIGIITALFISMWPMTRTTSPGQVEPTLTEEYIGEVTKDNVACLLPVIYYEESAFSIGVPNGWSSYGPEWPGYYRELPDNSLERLE